MSTVTLTLTMNLPALVVTGVALYLAPYVFLLVTDADHPSEWKWWSYLIFITTLPIWPAFVAVMFTYFAIRDRRRAKRNLEGFESPAEQVAESMRKAQ